MSIYDQISCAVSQVRSDVRLGKDVNESVVVATRGMNKEAVQRVIEEVNVNEFLDVLNSEGDKSRHFPVADPKVVFTKTAEISLAQSDLTDGFDIPGLDFYEDGKKAQANGFGPLPITENVQNSVSESQAAGYILGRKEIMQKKAEMYNDALTECEDIIAINLGKVASDIYCDQDKADRLFGNLVECDDGIVKSLCKLARVESRSPDEFIDESIENVKLMKQASRALDTYHAISCLKKNADDGVEKLAALISKTAISREPMKKEALGLGMLLPSIISTVGKPKQMPILPTEPEKPERSIILPSGVSVDDEYQRALAKYNREKKEYNAAIAALDEPLATMSLGKKTEAIRRVKQQRKELEEQEILKNIAKPREPWRKTKWVGEKAKGVGKGIASGLLGEEKQKNRFVSVLKGGIGSAISSSDKVGLESEMREEEQFGKALAQKMKQKSVIEDLIGNDEMLQEQDPEILAQLYNTLISLAPTIATNKEIVRSFLRQASAQAEPTIDWHTAQELIKLERLATGKKIEKD